MGNLLSKNKEEKQDGEMANRKEVRDNHVIREEITLTEQEMIKWVPAESEGDKEIIQERCMLDSPFKEVVGSIFTTPITSSLVHCGSRDFVMKAGIARKFSSINIYLSPFTMAE